MFIDHNALITSATEILPGLWLGNQKSSKDDQLLKKVDVIINCTKQLEFYKIKNKQHHYLRIPVNDPGAPNAGEFNKDHEIMYANIGKVIDKIHYFRSNRKNVLIHCHAGAQRSAAVMAAYLIKYGNWKFPPGVPQTNDVKYRKIIDLIVKKRPIAFYGGLSVNFAPTLKRYFNII